MAKQNGDPVMHGRAIRVLVNTGNYEADWSTYTPPNSESGLMVVAHNSNDDSTRLYIYADDAWFYIVTQVAD